MSNGSNVRPKTMIFRPKSPAGGQAAPKPQRAASDPAAGATQAGVDQPGPPPDAGQKPVQRIVITPPAAEAQVSPEAAGVEPGQDAPVPPPEEQAPQPEPDRPHSRKFTLKKSEEVPAEAAVAAAAVQEPAHAEAAPASAKGKFRFGKKGAAVSAPVEPEAPAAADKAQPVARPLHVKSYLAAYLKLTVWAILIGACSFTGYWLATRGTTVGRFGGIIGRVDFMTGKYMRMAESRARIVSGDLIKASLGSSACVLVSGNDSMQVYGPTETILRLYKKKENQPELMAIELLNGTVDMDVLMPMPDRIFTISTTNAIVKFTSGRFMLLYTNSCTRLSVREGLVTIGQRGGEKQALEIEAGNEVIVGEGIPFVEKSLSGETIVKELSLVTVLNTPFGGVDNPLKSSVVVDRNKEVALLAVKAVTDPPLVGSVKFEMQGCPPVIVNDPVDNAYLFRGPPKAGGVGEGWNPERGEYKLDVTAYSRKDGKGKPSFPKSVIFKVKGVAEY